MRTSQLTSLLKPTGNEKISRGTLAYVCARARQQAYNLLVSEFKKSGISQADFAKRWGKSDEVVSRLFSRPRNVEIDTLSGGIFALNGALLTFGIFPQMSETIQAKRFASSETANLLQNVVPFKTERRAA